MNTSTTIPPTYPKGDFSVCPITLCSGEVLELPVQMKGEFTLFIGLPADAGWGEIKAVCNADNDKARDFFRLYKEEIAQVFAPLEEWRKQMETFQQPTNQQYIMNNETNTNVINNELTFIGNS